MYDGQIEMSFAHAGDCRSFTQRQRRLSRAQWWFQRMRQVVERATDWRVEAAPRPEQIWLPGARHQNLETRQQHQQQVCE